MKRTVKQPSIKQVQQYVDVRMGMLIDERAKNDNEIAHMVIDKCVGELSYITEYIKRLDEQNNAK
jgi:hypothetical protein|tara:strand:+ start:1112 stop:1306 length:195 start_codon:yes stop_codon:yes gene_type:complete